MHTLDSNVYCDDCFLNGFGLIHLKFPLTKDNQGPADLKDFDHFGCWCCDPNCDKWKELDETA